MNDERIIGLFFERSETAISELEKKYPSLKEKIIGGLQKADLNGW